ncbi:peptide methionine sulfoxide reductase MsrB [Striga asiatica]|uniref:Peptide methionine sulfoxide reductase MsrB n=1 Tax=Striga asiatica TaxID=4170 RepID=A0A5A7QYW5_STRAF|nr:peptide methionine sulfoxide reductase MsrB [Striga asiatica]
MESSHLLSFVFVFSEEEFESTSASPVSSLYISSTMGFQRRTRAFMNQFETYASRKRKRDQKTCIFSSITLLLSPPSYSQSPKSTESSTIFPTDSSLQKLQSSLRFSFRLNKESTLFSSHRNFLSKLSTAVCMTLASTRATLAQDRKGCKVSDFKTAFLNVFFDDEQPASSDKLDSHTPYPLMSRRILNVTTMIDMTHARVGIRNSFAETYNSDGKDHSHTRHAKGSISSTGRDNSLR